VFWFWSLDLIRSVPKLIKVRIYLSPLYLELRKIDWYWSNGEFAVNYNYSRLLRLNVVNIMAESNWTWKSTRALRRGRVEYLERKERNGKRWDAPRKWFKADNLRKLSGNKAEGKFHVEILICSRMTAFRSESRKSRGMIFYCIDRFDIQSAWTCNVANL